MRPAYRAKEEKSPPPFLPGNRWVFRWTPRTRSFQLAFRWLPALTILAVLNCSAQIAPSTTLGDFGDSAQSDATPLPDSPGTMWNAMLTPPSLSLESNDQNPGPFNTSQTKQNGKPGQTPCTPRQRKHDYPRFRRDPCDPYRPFVEGSVPPLTSKDKAYLAIHDVTDPFNLLTIVGTSAFTIGINSHTAFGPGMRGFGYNVGTSFSQDVTGEFIGTYVVDSVFREDPRYFRMPNARPWRRLAHAISHLAVAQGDNGKPIPNYSNFIAAAAGAEIANLYVPGLATNGASTAERIITGIVTEPVGNIVAEFLPDIASHIHVHVVVLQRYLNQISAQQ